MNENGSDAGVRNIGRLALSLIVASLGIGASIWLGVWMGIHNFKHQVSQEERAAIYVGAEKLPTSKLQIEIRPSGCVKMTKADIDGGTLMLYAKNECHREIDPSYLEWHWRLLSPDGTAIHQGYTNQCPIPDVGGTAECILNGYSSLPEDNRASKVVVWVSGLFNGNF